MSRFIKQLSCAGTYTVHITIPVSTELRQEPLQHTQPQCHSICQIHCTGGDKSTIITLPTICLFTIPDRLGSLVPPHTCMGPHLTLSTTHHQCSPICQKAWEVKAVAGKKVVGCDLQHTGGHVETATSMGDFWYSQNLLIPLWGFLYPLLSLSWFLIPPEPVHTIAGFSVPSPKSPLLFN